MQHSQTGVAVRRGSVVRLSWLQWRHVVTQHVECVSSTVKRKPSALPHILLDMFRMQHPDNRSTVPRPPAQSISEMDWVHYIVDCSNGFSRLTVACRMLWMWMLHETCCPAGVVEQLSRLHGVLPATAVPVLLLHSWLLTKLLALCRAVRTTSCQ